MAMHLHLDAVGGVAGDMFIAALLDAFPEHRAGMLDAIRAAGLPPEVALAVREHRDHALTGLRFQVDEPDPAMAAHVPFVQVRERLSTSALPEAIKASAIAIFTLLAGAEARVHGRSLEQVSFHEVGAWDSVADVVGAAYLITHIHAATWSVSALPLGSGRVNSAHGPLPLPAPATALLLEGFAMIDDGVAGERVTPTGAAILRHLGCTQRSDAQTRKLIRSGIGFGARWMAGISNVLRVLVFEPATADTVSDQVAQILFEVDDQSPEDLALGLDRLRAHPAVLDVLQLAGFGKKGRMTAHIQILARPEALQDVCEVCFRETSTIGVRYQLLARSTLVRRSETIGVETKTLRAKIVERPGAPSAKIESDDLVSVAGGRVEREHLRRQAEAIALSKED